MRIPLVQGAYEARSIIASAQRAVNLYPEMNPSDSPVPVTHYVTPGTNLLIAGTGSPCRCTYRSSNGKLYMVIGNAVYYVDSNFNRTLLGTITYNTTPVSMADNGLIVIIVDGTAAGWCINLANNQFAPIPLGAPFYGANRVDYIDTFFILNRPGTNQWYISLSQPDFTLMTSVFGSITDTSVIGGSGYTDGTYTNHALLGGSGGGATGTFTITGGVVGSVTIVNPGAGYAIGDSLTASGIGPGAAFSVTVLAIGGGFNALDIATKNGYPDPIVSIIVMHREIWLIGELTTEIWYNSGAADFPFQAMPGAFVEHGCGAVYTVVAQDLSTYWLSLDKQGRAIFLRGAQYQVFRISTHAIENTWAEYPTTSDAISFVYQQDGHTFIFVTFPSGNATWVYDQTTELWHERAWTDNNGILNRHRANCCANAYNRIVVGDFQNGNLYQLTLDDYTDYYDGNGLNDNGSYPMSFIRSFPHIVRNGNRLSYSSFIADMQAGTDPGADGLHADNPPTVYLRWSDNRGASYGNRIGQSFGAAGQYLTQPQWPRLGFARDRVFELSWSTATLTALNGAWINVTEALS